MEKVDIETCKQACVNNCSCKAAIFQYGSDNDGYLPFELFTMMNVKYQECRIRHNVQVIWQIPGSPRSILFIAHGCNGRAANFWDKSPNCDNCVGLPEERAIVKEALARKTTRLRFLFICRKKMIDVNLEVLRREGVDVTEEKWFVDEDEEGYLVNDGRVIPWKEAMSERKLSLPNKVLVKYIQEKLNLAFAYHEMTSLQSEQIFDWFEYHLR
ncbi:putative PAN/Apple domain-containing protein [Helianthus anomalus]